MKMKPLKTSVLLGCAYIFVCSLYILVSSSIAEKMSQSLPNLRNIELMKGLAFVFVTGILLFLFIFTLMVRIRNQNRELYLQRIALIQSQARALNGTFAAGIAHDINNVLNIIDFSVSELQEKMPSTEKTYFESINQSYSLIKEMASRLQKIGSAQIEPELKETNIQEFINQTVNFARRHKKIKPCNVTLIQNGNCTLKINPFLVEQMILNLLINAADATKSQGKIDVRVDSKPDKVAIEIHDNGPGINADARNNLFSPYFTTKADGTGLGLATVKACVEQHGGTVDVDISDLGGAAFKIHIPKLITTSSGSEYTKSV